ncbi:MAG: polysaccharide biosynthesis/export family protein [Bacteroidales bacterium]|nr:polysaccharide biosynthesis/export family protein [Bacteroidales bacterium]MCF8345015.1 polysaccharide biosynthesis/export family protein [Bacteroidales bacterium]MCF8351039.1 polysaccharide biosynthesis/export family protein [Bacteroidales bacterium]MCF8375895.1 polysaccharide biosynthesis/export family protein [Bacteroidales bacterium]MCF8402003.1 polysaccharide biosynthesis/export family protein [Bacteroidales bacterium]
MNNTRPSHNKGFLFVLAIALLLGSCVPQKKIKYLQSKVEETQAQTNFENPRKFEYKIQPGDNLYIKIVSVDEKHSNMFNTMDSRYANAMQSDAGIYLNSYTVNEEGDVDFPLIGKVHVKNLTVEEVKEELQESLNEYIKESVVIVKMVNFYVTMLGEVTRPGEYKIFQDELNIFEAISIAGDLTDFANRNEVKLVRQTKKGSEIINIDLTDRSLLASDYYFLMPNDILYVEPLKGKQFTFANFPYGIIFSAISTTLLLINYFN